MNIQKEMVQLFRQHHLLGRKEEAVVLEACRRQRIPAKRFLMEQRGTTAGELLAPMSEFYRMPGISMSLLEPDPELVHRFGLPFLRRHRLVPITFTDEGILLVAEGRPGDAVACSNLAVLYDGRIEGIYVPEQEIESYLDTLEATRNTMEALSGMQKEQESGILGRMAAAREAAEAEAGVLNTPVVRLVDSLIREAVPYRASDVHIEPSDTVVRIRYRIDGDLLQRAEFPMEHYPAIVSRLKVLSGINVAETRQPQDGRISMTVNGKDYDFRVSTLPMIYGEKFVIRILDKSAFRMSRSELGFSQENNAVLNRVLAAPHGIILLCGPTGSGKSTTLYTFLKELNTDKVNIVTVEDPVEYTLPGINQVQINPRANLSFANAIRSILRQDPDIIMVGEIRDEETAQMAIRAAITGHLVLSTIHTSDAPGAVTRLIEMGASNYLVADALVAVIAQRLVKRLCPVCRKKSRTNAREMALLHLTEPATICRPVGCPSCNHTGYKGRFAVHELMELNEALRAQINEPHLILEQFRGQARQSGMKTLWETCRESVLRGETSTEELMRLTTETEIGKTGKQGLAKNSNLLYDGTQFSLNRTEAAEEE